MKFDYYLYKKYLNLKNIKAISKAAKKYANPNLKDNKAKNAIKTSRVKIVEYRYTKKHLEALVDIIDQSNKRYFGFTLYSINDCHGLNLNEYLPNDSVGYDWHLDGDKNHADDVKLTTLVNLSTEKYTGGQFKIFSCEDIDFSEPGDVLIFKSFMPHKVEKIISGKRTTLTLWMEGPCFK